jgi:hypothetical protein
MQGDRVGFLHGICHRGMIEAHYPLLSSLAAKLFPTGRFRPVRTESTRPSRSSSKRPSFDLDQGTQPSYQDLKRALPSVRWCH